MRFSEIDTDKHNQLDFVPRSRRNDIWNVAIAFISIIVLILVSSYAPFFYRMDLYGPVLAILLMIALCLYVVYRKQMNLDLVMSTEYQNMLFAQALTLGASFTMIVRRDGAIVYANDGLKTMFPRFDYAQSQALEGIFEQGIVRKIDRERIMGALYSGTTERLIFPILTQYSDKKDYIVTVEPLVRPSGFSVIRGREYHGKRTGSEIMPDMLRSTSIDKLDRLLSTTPTGLYTTDSFGRFEYVNPAFEKMLGYGPSDIMEAKLSLHHVFFSMGKTLLTEEHTPADFGGDATLVTKSGAHANRTVVQQTIRDAGGKILGATGSIVHAGTH